MSLIEDWYLYHSNDENNWFLQAGGPYTEQQSIELLKQEEAKRKDIEYRIARIAYPQGATPDKKIERHALDLENQHQRPDDDKQNENGKKYGRANQI